MRVGPPTLTFAHGLCGWRARGRAAARSSAAWKRAAPVGPEMRLYGHHPAGRVVGELEPEATVDLGLVLRRGAGEHVEQVAEAVHQGDELARAVNALRLPGDAFESTGQPAGQQEGRT